MLFNRNTIVFAITIAVISLLSVEVAAKKYRYKDITEDYKEFPTTAKKDSFVVFSNTDGSETIVVELKLGGLGKGDVVMVTDNTKDVTVRRPRKYYYKMIGNQVVVSDQSYNVDHDSQDYVAAPSDVITFVSTSGRALVVYEGKNTGQLSGSYRRFITRDNMCMKSDMQLTSGSLDCDKDLESSNYASSCRGNIHCPADYISTGYAACFGGKWRGMCLPGPNALATLDQCPPKKLATCALTDDFITSIYELEYTDDQLSGRMEGLQMDAGRSPTSRAELMRRKCTNFCNPEKNCFNNYFPSDFNDAKAVKRYVLCARCVNYHHCNFDVKDANGIFN